MHIWVGMFNCNHLLCVHILWFHFWICISLSIYITNQSKLESRVSHRNFLLYRVYSLLWFCFFDLSHLDHIAVQSGYSFFHSTQIAFCIASQIMLSYWSLNTSYGCYLKNFLVEWLVRRFHILVLSIHLLLLVFDCNFWL